MTGKLVIRNTGNAVIALNLLAKGNSANEVTESEAGITGSASLCTVSQASTNGTYTVAEGEG